MQGDEVEAEPPIIGIEIDCTVIAGRGLVGKDSHLFGKKTSDPFVVISYAGGPRTPMGQRTLGTTTVVKKNLSPEWNQHFKLNLGSKAAAALDSTELVFTIFDKDKVSANDPMGVVRTPHAKHAPPHHTHTARALCRPNPSHLHSPNTTARSARAPRCVCRWRALPAAM